MSTKAIRKALRDMQCDYNPCLPGTCRKHEALEKVEATERAAKVLKDGMDYAAMRYAPPEIYDAMNVIYAIAKELP